MQNINCTFFNLAFSFNGSDNKQPNVHFVSEMHFMSFLSLLGYISSSNISCLLFLKKVSDMDGSFPPLAFTLQYPAYSVPKFSISSLLLQARQFRHGSSSEVICSSDQHRYPQVQSLWLSLRTDGQKWCLCEWSELYFFLTLIFFFFIHEFNGTASS